MAVPVKARRKGMLTKQPAGPSQSKTLFQPIPRASSYGNPEAWGCPLHGLYMTIADSLWVGFTAGDASDARSILSCYAYSVQAYLYTSTVNDATPASAIRAASRPSYNASKSCSTHNSPQRSLVS